MNISRHEIGAAIAVLFVLGGCAGSAPMPQFTDPAAENFALDGNDTAEVKVEAAQGLSVPDTDLQRLREVIQQQLVTGLARNPAAGAAQNYDVRVIITKYAKGNAFARAMLAGLGQIHIDGTVFVTTAGADEKLSEFTVKKTFAWGGLYGGTTRIEDVEPAFAEGVVAGVTGQVAAGEQVAGGKNDRQDREAGR